MTHKNVALYEALQAYVPAAIKVFAKLADLPSLKMSYGSNVNHWVRLESNGDLTELPEYQHCLKIIKSDQVIASQLDAYIGTHLGGSRSDSAEGLMRWLPDLGMSEHRFKFDSEHFELEYQSFEDAFYSSDIVFEAVAYLQGLMINRSVKLSDNLELGLLTEKEIENIADLKIRKTSGDPSVNQLCAVRTWYSLKRIIGDHSLPESKDVDREREIQHQANDRIDELINALRLYGVENVYYQAIIHRASVWLPLRAYTFSSKYLGEPMLWLKQSEGWEGAFHQFWLDLQSEGVKKREFLEVAIRRFSYGHERHRLEDRVIDLFIAAEALFMSDFEPKKNPYVGELRYRLSERVGLFVGGSDMTVCRNVFRHMRDAYDLRSSIVHGSRSDERKFPKKQDGSRMSLEEFVWAIQEYMRIAIRKSIHLATLPNSPMPLVNWDELIFSKKEPSDHK
jgi:hypothetical protein